MKKSLIWKSTAALAAVGGLAGVISWLVAATAFVPANQPSGYMGQLEVTNFNLSGGHEYVFKTDFEKQNYSGNIFAYPVGTDGVINTPGEVFDGGVKAHLDAQNFDTGRIIATMNSSGVGVPFRWPASVTASTISASQKTAIGASTILDFVRGDRSNETVGLAYRLRSSVLGDIMHSRPFYLGNSGSPVLFVGANDGMLHAFNALSTGGNELWAYVPSMLLGNLSALTADPYVHTYYVDGGLNVGDIQVSGVTKKILVSGLGAGGKGLFALDITNPIPTTEAQAATKALWEITSTTINNATSTSYQNLGYTYSTPIIGKVNSGSGQYAVLIGNGYNSGQKSSLLVIDASNGSLIKEIVTSGSAGGGLSTPACYDSNGNGLLDYCYAGDIDGKLWKFDLTNALTINWTATLLHPTSPAQAITMAPSLSTHPNGGVMVNFGTGQMFVAADVTDTSTYYAYGIWDGAPTANTAILGQTLTERSYTFAGTTTRVRSVTTNAPNWASGASNHKGWRVPLPAGERIIGDTVFTESGRFYFNAYNPTIDNSALSPPVPNGENWLMELDYLSGGAANSPFLDLNGDQLLNNADRIKYVVTDTIPAGSAVGDPILTASGIAAGKFVSNGISSHPLLVQLATLNTTLLNQNPDVVIPATLTDRGVAGGHFDVDIWYPSGTPPLICSYSGGSSATVSQATITVTSTGSSRPATLGGITVGGVSIMGPLTTSDITDGTDTSTNATTIRDKINALTATSGFTATRSGSVVTVKAPAGTGFNAATFTFAAGTSSSGSSASGNPTGTFQITNATTRSKDFTSIKCPSGGTNIISTVTTPSSSTASNSARVASLATQLSDSSNWKNGYSVSCTSPGTGTTSTCTVTGPTGPAACSQLSISKDSSISVSSTTPSFSGGVAAVTGFDNLAARLTGSTFSTASAAVLGPFSSCAKNTHFHEYDDIFNVTGVNMLNASSTSLNISLAMGNTVPFKVLVHNQYMNPAVTLSVGGAPHVSVKTYNSLASETVAASVIANAPVYTRDTVQTLEWNMPTDAFVQKDWWGGSPADVRVGLMPTEPGCVYNSDSSHGNNLFYPVNPPAAGSSANGTVGTTTGVRHNGALTVQLIKDTTPATSIELNIASRPEFGWRVKAADFETYVLAEWVTYWHHPSDICFGETGWTKLAAKDLTPSDSSVWRTPAAGSDDPNTGSFRATSAIVSVATTVTGSVTTTVTTYADGKTLRVVKTANADGTTTIVTTLPDGSATTVTVPNTTGRVTTGGDEKGSQAKTGRISWSERLRN
jgi:hypothetical protein